MERTLQWRGDQALMSGVWIQWNGMVDRNDGMEWWTGTVEWNGLIEISSHCQLFAVTTQQFVYTSVGR